MCNTFRNFVPNDFYNTIFENILYTFRLSYVIYDAIFNNIFIINDKNVKLFYCFLIFVTLGSILFSMLRGIGIEESNVVPIPSKGNLYAHREIRLSL